ncbi:MAG: phosphate acyltransferase PlsX [Candidatus Promineifilaceae bacterium]
MRIVVDAMGSDTHPEPDVAGAILAAREFGDEIFLVGDEKQINAELGKTAIDDLPIRVIHASQVINMTDKPSEASRVKKDSSMHVGLNLVKNGEADAFVSVGNTGGILAVAMLHTLRRIPGVKRPALGVIFPLSNNPLLIDNGANTDAKPDYMLQFAVMGSLYVERVRGLTKPRVGLISNGEEEGKGNQLIKETMPLLAESGLNFIGNIEPNEFVQGKVDVGVTDGFTGNIILKTAEAVAGYMNCIIRDEIRSNVITMAGGLLARPAFKRVGQRLDPDEVGGAPLLGVNGVVIVGHGQSSAYAVKQAIGQARLAVERDIVGAIRDGLGT